MATRYFTSRTFEFLSDLEANNDRTWFKANKARYDSTIKEAALDFIEDFAKPLQNISKHFVADPSPADKGAGPWSGEWECWKISREISVTFSIRHGFWSELPFGRFLRIGSSGAYIRSGREPCCLVRLSYTGRVLGL